MDNNNEIMRECPRCETVWIFNQSEVILEPWPHVECPKDGEWIPVF